VDPKLTNFFEILPNKQMLVKQGKYVEIRLHDDYFNSNIATMIGDGVETFGFLDIFAWDSYTDDMKDSDATKISMRLPTTIVTKPMRIVNDSKNSMTILEYHGGDQFVVSTLVAKSHSRLFKYFNLMLTGKLPDDIGYDKIVSYFETCAIINGINIKANSIFLDIIAMVVSRDPENLSRQFRQAIKANPKVSMTARKLVNMDVIPSLTSQFSALTGSNPKYGITSSIGAVRSGDFKPAAESDIEKAIK